MTALATVTRVYQALGAGDLDTLGQLLGDTHWEEAQGGPYGGTYRGAEEIAGNVFRPIRSDVRNFSGRPDELLPIGEDRVLALGRYRGETDRGPLDIRFAHLWTVADDRIRHFEQFTDTHQWHAAVGQ